MARRNWTREEDLAVLYAKLTHGNAFRLHPDLRNLSLAMGRSTSSLLMRKANFDAPDPSVPSSGLSNARYVDPGGLERASEASCADCCRGAPRLPEAVEYANTTARDMKGLRPSTPSPSLRLTLLIA